MPHANFFRADNIPALLLVAASTLSALAIDWLVVSWRYPIAAAYGVAVLIAATSLGARIVLTMALLAPALSVSSDVLQDAPLAAVVADGGALTIIGLLAYRASRHQSEIQHARAASETARGLAENANQHLRVQYEAARALGEAVTLSEAAGVILPSVCAHLGWSCGLLWTVDSDAGLLRCAYAWSKPDAETTAFVENRPSLGLQRESGLPGSVWLSGQPRWLSDIQHDGNFPRLVSAAKAGIRTGLGFPIKLGDQVLGVMEFFAQEDRSRDEAMLASLTTTGGQIGQFLERRKAEQQIRDLLASEQAAHARAEEAVRQRDVLLATITHDMRGPLTSVIGSAQLLRRQAKRSETLASEHVLNGVDRIETVARRMSRLVDGLLDLALVQAGQPLPIRLEPTDLAAVVQQIVAERRAAQPDREIRVETSLHTLVGEWDASRLERAVDNLVGNALKYSPADAPVTIQLRSDGEPETRWAVLEVQDQGVGIPAADLPYIFDHFHRGTNVAAATTGVGIGLSGTREIIQRHGGTITMQSELGKGSVCTVRLPLAAAVSGASTARESAGLDRPTSLD